MAQDEKRADVSPRARLYNLTSLAFTFPVSISAGAFIGYYLDGKLGTFPWLSIVFLLFGIAAGFLSLLRAVKMFDARDP
jgi:ATP synthase protein I